MTFSSFIFNDKSKRLLLLFLLGIVIVLLSSLTDKQQRARKVVFFSQSLPIDAQLLPSGTSYIVFQNKTKRDSNSNNPREKYDLIGYVYDANDNLLRKKVKLDRITSGEHDRQLRPEDDVNLSLYRLDKNVVDSIKLYHPRAKNFILRPYYSDEAHHIEYVVYPDDFVLPEPSGKDSIEVDKNWITYLKFGNLVLKKDYMYLNPSPPRNLR